MTEKEQGVEITPRAQRANAIAGIFPVAVPFTLMASYRSGLEIAANGTDLKTAVVGTVVLVGLTAIVSGVSGSMLGNLVRRTDRAAIYGWYVGLATGGAASVASLGAGYFY